MCNVWEVRGFVCKIRGFRVQKDWGKRIVHPVKSPELQTIPDPQPETVTATQSLQNPLVKEYTLNHIRNPIII